MISLPAGTCRKILPPSSAMFIASSEGLYASRDGGDTWEASHEGFYSMDVSSLAHAPSSPNIVYLEARENGFYKSADFGATWQKMPYFYRCDTINKILVNPTDSLDLYILAGG